MIELAVVLPLLLFIMMGIFDFSRFYYTRITMQHAVREAVRFAITGNTTNDPQTGNPRTRVESIRAKIVDNAIRLDIDVNAIDINPADGGGPGQVVTVRTDFTYQFGTPLIKPLFPGGVYPFTVASSMKNEPFIVAP